MQKQPPEVFYKKAVLKIPVICTGKYLCFSLFSIQNMVKFLRKAILKNICEPLLFFFKYFFNVMRNKLQTINIHEI